VRFPWVDQITAVKTSSTVDSLALSGNEVFVFLADHPSRAGPYGLRSPFVWDQDLTVRRTFTIRENLKLEAAVSAFNIYNSVNFGGVSTVLDSTTFGQVTNQANSPRKLQGEARISF
jgi:hypothetical protein